MAKQGDGWVSPAEFARLSGYTREGIYGLIRTGRIPADCVRKQGKFQAILADDALAAIRGTVREQRAPRREQESLELRQWSPDEIPPIDESNAAEKYWKARRAELDYRRAAGDLIEASGVESAYADEVAACRTKLLSIVSRIRQRLSLAEDDYALIDDLIREALEDLGRSGGRAREADDEDQF